MKTFFITSGPGRKPKTGVHWKRSISKDWSHKTIKEDTYCHIWFASRFYGLSNRINEVSTNSEITYFNLSFSVYKNIRRFHVPVYHMKFCV